MAGLIEIEHSELPRDWYENHIKREQIISNNMEREKGHNTKTFSLWAARPESIENVVVDLKIEQNRRR